MTLQEALTNAGFKTEPKPTKRLELTAEQIKNWRTVLFLDPQIGPAVSILSDDEIVRIANLYVDRINREASK